MTEKFRIPDEFTEAYEVVRTVELYSRLDKARQHYRVQIVRVLRGGKGDYHAHYAEDVRGVWTRLMHVAWVASDDADTATHQALVHLASFSRAPVPQHRGKVSEPLNSTGRVARLSSNELSLCEHCEFSPPDVGKAINHYTAEHGYRLLHVGSETERDSNGDPWHSTVAILGTDNPPPMRRLAKVIIGHTVPEGEQGPVVLLPPLDDDGGTDR
jgi:hypothetical protein